MMPKPSIERTVNGLRPSPVGHVKRRLTGLMSMRDGVNRKLGMTLTELSVTLLIISILAAMYLGAIGKAYVTIKAFLKETFGG
jgi:prepilin-type N-terminal cleavage/methylation domain-containing protein